MIAITAIAGVACSTRPAIVACEPAAAWLAASQRQPAETTCEGGDQRIWQEAHNLGVQYAEFKTRLVELDREITRLEVDPQAARRVGQLKLQRVKLAREIEMITGIASVRGWGSQEQVQPLP
jgi:hypothetical protein